MGEQETVIYEVLGKAQADGTLSQTQDARAKQETGAAFWTAPVSATCELMRA
jgi:hypothetical protein